MAAHPPPERSTTPQPPSTSSSSNAHPLLTPWALWFCPNMTPDMMKLGYDVATKQYTKLIDKMHSIEEMWSFVNALPPTTKIGTGNTIMYFREGYPPFWEDSAWKATTPPKGGRIIFKLDPVKEGDEFINHVLMHVLGELAAHTLQCGPIICGIKAVRRETKKEDFVKLELWLTESSFNSKLQEYFFEVGRSVGVHNLANAGNCEIKGFE